jgi:hypothetical protein
MAVDLRAAKHVGAQVRLVKAHKAPEACSLENERTGGANEREGEAGGRDKERYTYTHIHTHTHARTHTHAEVSAVAEQRACGKSIPRANKTGSGAETTTRPEGNTSLQEAMNAWNSP